MWNLYEIHCLFRTRVIISFFNKPLVYIYGQLKTVSLDAHSFCENYFLLGLVRFKAIFEEEKKTA